MSHYDDDFEPEEPHQQQAPPPPPAPAQASVVPAEPAVAEAAAPAPAAPAVAEATTVDAPAPAPTRPAEATAEQQSQPQPQQEIVPPTAATEQQQQPQPSAAAEAQDPLAATASPPPTTQQGEQQDTTNTQQKNTTNDGGDDDQQQPKTQRIGFACARCGCVLFGGARLQVASVALPDCPDCKKLGYGEFFYSPAKIKPDETRGAILKKKNAEALKVTIQQKWQRTLGHARAQMEAVQEYISKQRGEKCTRVHRQQNNHDDNNKENDDNKEGGTRRKDEQQQQQQQQHRTEDDNNKSTRRSKSTKNKEDKDNKISADQLQQPAVFAQNTFDISAVSTANLHGAALAAASGDDLRKTAETEALRLNVTVQALLAVPGYIDCKGRRLGIKRHGTHYEIGFGFSATPLHFACLACRADLVATLLDLGADPNAVAGPSSINVANKALLAPSSIDLSKANEFSAVVSLLEHSVADSREAKFKAVCDRKLSAARERVKSRRFALETS